MFRLCLGSLHISKKIIENCNSVGAEAHKVGKIVSFGPTLTLILPISGELKKSKLHILKKVGVSTFKEIFKKYVYNSTVMFFNILLFCLKGYSKTLTYLLVHQYIFRNNFHILTVTQPIIFILSKNFQQKLTLPPPPKEN